MCGFGNIYSRNPEWKTSFFVHSWFRYQSCFECQHDIKMRKQHGEITSHEHSDKI